MSIAEVIAALVADKKNEIEKEIQIINEGIEYLQMEQESLMSSDTLSDDIIQETFECHKIQMSLTAIKCRFKYLQLNISDTDEVSDIYTHYGLSRNEWLENYKKGKAYALPFFFYKNSHSIEPPPCGDMISAYILSNLLFIDLINILWSFLNVIGLNSIGFKLIGLIVR